MDIGWYWCCDVHINDLIKQDQSNVGTPLLNGMQACLRHLHMANSHQGSSAVDLLFYVHGKHLRSCRDGQLT